MTFYHQTHRLELGHAYWVELNLIWKTIGSSLQFEGASAFGSPYFNLSHLEVLQGRPIRHVLCSLGVIYGQGFLEVLCLNVNRFFSILSRLAVHYHLSLMYLISREWHSSLN